MSNKEVELVLYVELENPNFEATEGSETWTQYEAEFSTGERQRVRIYGDGRSNQPKCTQTIKIEAGEVNGIDASDEYECEIPHGFALGFAKAAKTKQNKRRDYFKSNHVTLKLSRGEEVEEHDTPELTIECDRFFLKDGGYSKWAKIDIEIQDLIAWVKNTYGVDKVTGFHIELDDILPTRCLRIIQSNTEDEEEKKILSELWETQFKENLK